MHHNFNSLRILIIVLQKICDILPNFGKPETAGAQAKQAWWDISDNILLVIRGAIDKLLQKGLITKERKEFYHKSGRYFGSLLDSKI